MFIQYFSSNSLETASWKRKTTTTHKRNFGTNFPTTPTATFCVGSKPPNRRSKMEISALFAWNCFQSWKVSYVFRFQQTSCGKVVDLPFLVMIEKVLLNRTSAWKNVHCFLDKMSTSEPKFMCDGSNFAAHCIPFKCYVPNPSPKVLWSPVGVFEWKFWRTELVAVYVISSVHRSEYS
jgi:hypothetical protein